MLDKENRPKTEPNDPLTSLATVVWYGIGMAVAALLLGVPYLLFWDSLPTAVKFWLDPWLLLVVIAVIGMIFTLLIKKLLDK